MWEWWAKGRRSIEIEKAETEDSKSKGAGGDGNVGPFFAQIIRGSWNAKRK